MKRSLYTLLLLLFCQMSYSQFFIYEQEENSYEKGFAFAKCKSIMDEVELNISCSQIQGRIIFYMNFYFDDLCMDNKQQVVISYKIGEKYSRYTFTVSDNTTNYEGSDGTYAFIDYKSDDYSEQGISIVGIKNYEQFWQDFNVASRMCVKIEETNECEETEVVFSMEGSTKAYNYLRNHPTQPKIVYYHH